VTKYTIYFYASDRIAGYALGLDAEDAINSYCRRYGGNPCSYDAEMFN
jgi:hypothetical protein